MAEVVVEQLTEATERAVTELAQLLRQLTLRAQALDVARLQRIIDAPGGLYVALAEGRIVGTVCRLDLYHPVRTRCWLDDLVVDETFRGQGIALRLMEAAITGAPAEAVSVGLSSKLSRVDSHKLYKKLGFEVREDTRIWRLMLPER